MRLEPTIRTALLLCLAAGRLAAFAQSDEKLAYPGIEADATWRIKAGERIDAIRKADLVVTVTNAAGEPVKDAEVTVRQQRHAFRFSCQVRPALLGEPDAGSAFTAQDAERYRQTVGELFNCVYPPADAPPEAAAAVQRWAEAHALLKREDAGDAIDVPADFTPVNVLPPEDLLRKIDELAGPEKTLRAADFRLIVDPANAGQLQFQANYLRDYFTALFSRAEVVEIGIAGFWAPALPEQGWALYNADWSPRPAGEMFLKVVKKQWWTNDTGLTNAAGECSIRCFLGEYRVSVSAGGKSITVNATVPASGAKVAIKLQKEPLRETGQ